MDAAGPMRQPVLLVSWDGASCRGARVGQPLSGSRGARRLNSVGAAPCSMRARPLGHSIRGFGGSGGGLRAGQPTRRARRRSKALAALGRARDLGVGGRPVRHGPRGGRRRRHVEVRCLHQHVGHAGRHEVASLHDGHHQRIPRPVGETGLWALPVAPRAEATWKCAKQGKRWNT